MRKHAARFIMIPFLLVLVLAGCGGQQDSSKAANDKEKEQHTEAKSAKAAEQEKPKEYRDFSSETKKLTDAFKQASPSQKKLLGSIAADVNGDGEPELIVLQGTQSAYGANDVFENYEFSVYDPKTKSIVYRDGDLDLVTGIPQKLMAGDFTGDQTAEVKAAILNDGTAGGSYDILLSYQDGKYVNLFKNSPFAADVRTSALPDGRLLIYSDSLKEYHYMNFTEEQKAAGSLDVGWRGSSRDAIQAGEHFYTLQEIFSVTGPLYNSDFMAKVTIDYEFKEGTFVPTKLQVESLNGQPITKGDPPIAFVLDDTLKASILKGEIPGLGVKLGMKKAEVAALLGKQTREFDYTGGAFVEFEKAPGVAFCFSAVAESTDSLYSLLVYSDAVTGKTFPDLKKVLGEPAKSGIDDMEETYYYQYDYDKTSVIFDGEEAGNVKMMQILKK